MSRWVTALSGGLLAIAAVAWSEAAADDFRPEEGYVVLFNGKDLSGWEYGAVPPVKKPPPKEKLEGKTATSDGVFSVQDGLLVANGKKIRALYTAREFNKAFRLKFEFRTVADKPKNNSGLFIRGPQLQLDATNMGGLTGVFRKIKNFKVGDWNEIDVTVGDNALTTTVNGKPLTASDRLQLTVKGGNPLAALNGKSVDIKNIAVDVGAFAECLCDGESVGKAMRIPATGTIGLQSEYGQFEFRRIRIKAAP
jgi:hypothetical protein